MTTTPFIQGSHVYDHLGIVSTALDEQSGETTMPIADDIRHSGGLRIAALGLAFEHGVATYAFRRVTAVPIQIAMCQRDRGMGLTTIRSETRIVRLGRTLLVTSGDIRDAADASRLIAFGTIIWSVTGGPPAPAPLRPDPPAPDPRRAAMLDALAIETLGDGSGCRLESIHPSIAGPGGILHAGMSQLLGEQAALVVAGRSVDPATAAVADATHHFLQPGRTGPFIAKGTLLAANRDLDIQVEVRDAGQGGRVCSLSYFRITTVI